jgi:signal transduction histidine kinase
MLDDPGPDISVFLASCAHDMKNSLGVLSGMVERFLGTLSPDTFAGYRDLSSMGYEVKRINQDLVQLLALYKIGQQLYPFDPQPIVLREFIDNLAAQQRTLIGAHGCQLETDCPPELIWHFDEDLVEGVIGQALNNAAHYTRSRIRLTAAVQARQLEIRVEDDGSGFPPFMLDTHPAPVGIDFTRGSTGLGLHFARTVAGMHKNRGAVGTLRLENGGSLGGGCFILQLP